MADFEKIKLPTEKFEELLSNSPKLLFSGKFGSGKTTFINDFFKANLDKYEMLHIYPVNYSVVSTTDIFELIKYDILFQLLGKIRKEDFEKLDFPFELTLWHYLIGAKDIDSKADFLLSFFNFAGSTGKAVLSVYHKLEILKDKYSAFQKKLETNDFKSAYDFLENATQIKGHIYEEDFFTELIRKLIDQLKENEKEIVLVIDDLDRLDPDHIFRILNIFSAHMDFRGKEDDNKFNLDKVILVCDYENIESVFYHRYGYGADFKGYIDKFYSNAFWFDPSSKIKDYVTKYLELINNGDTGSLFHDYSRIGGHILFIMKNLIELNLINFRDLISYNRKFSERDLFILKAKLERYEKTILDTRILNTELVIYFLLLFFRSNTTGVLKIVKQARTIGAVKNFDSDDPKNLNKIGELLFLDNHNKFSEPNSFGGNETFEMEHSNLQFHCKLLKDNHSIGVECLKVVREGENVDPNDLNYFEFLENGIHSFLNRNTF